MIKILKDHFWLYVIWRIACRLFWIVTCPIWLPIVLICAIGIGVIEGTKKYLNDLRWSWRNE